MNVIFILLLSIFSLAAQADFIGSWQGKGFLENADGTPVYCDSMDVTFQKELKTFKAQPGEFECGGMTHLWLGDTFELSEGLLMKDQQVIGQISETGFTAKLVDPRSLMKLVYTAVLEDDRLKFKMEFYYSSDEKYFGIEGDFFKH